MLAGGSLSVDMEVKVDKKGPKSILTSRRRSGKRFAPGQACEGHPPILEGRRTSSLGSNCVWLMTRKS